MTPTMAAFDEMEAARLTATLGFEVTPDQVAADRAKQRAERQPEPERDTAATVAANAMAAALDGAGLHVTHAKATVALGYLTPQDRKRFQAKLYDLAARIDTLADSMR